MIKISSWIYGFSLIVLLSGCATRRDNIALAPVHLAKPSTVVIAQASGLEEGTFYKGGGQGIIDMMITEAVLDDFIQALKSIDTRDLLNEHYYQSFEQAFNDHSFRAVPVIVPFDQKTLPPALIDEARFAPYDLKEWKDRYKADYALLLDTSYFGVSRDYYGFIPLSAPKGCVGLHLYLVKLEDNTLIGHHYTDVEMPVQGDWDRPPSYSSVIDATKNALIKALQDSRIYFFGWKPKR